MKNVICYVFWAALAIFLIGGGIYSYQNRIVLPKEHEACQLTDTGYNLKLAEYAEKHSTWYYSAIVTCEE